MDFGNYYKGTLGSSNFCHITDYSSVLHTTSNIKAFLAREQDIYTTSRALKAMAHPLRLKIVCLVGRNTELTVQDLVSKVGTTQSNVSQHLAKLREKGILTTRRDFNRVYYRMADNRIEKLVDTLRGAFAGQTD